MFLNLVDFIYYKFKYLTGSIQKNRLYDDCLLSFNTLLESYNLCGEEEKEALYYFLDRFEEIRLYFYFQNVFMVSATLLLVSYEFIKDDNFINVGNLFLLSLLVANSTFVIVMKLTEKFYEAKIIRDINSNEKDRVIVDSKAPNTSTDFQVMRIEQADVVRGVG